MRTPPPLLSPEDVDRRLDATLPRWRRDGGTIVRTYRTHGWKGTLMVVNAIGHLAEAAWHHPALAVGYDGVTVRLDTHESGGITERDMALATEIERVVTWRPAAPLEGTPDDARHAYLRRD
ncbi:MAG: 4a-hydroxytetrahydrobiopterin dehydratase [Alphaproteobacteria bacterium]|nr:4a-hydroxytetrahydrobiopterin dehydratase [Alphaproteobacteria bacterium]